MHLFYIMNCSYNFINHEEATQHYMSLSPAHKALTYHDRIDHHSALLQLFGDCVSLNFGMAVFPIGLHVHM